MSQFREIRWHGRGGQGAWTASELLAKAAILEGRHVQSFPEFGPERMGAPLASFTRISDESIRLHCSIYNPDVAVVLDPTLLKTVKVTKGLAEDGILVVNTQESPQELRKKLDITSQKVWTVPATDIAIKILNVPITNTAMLGAATRAASLVSLESIEKVVRKRFTKEELAERNVAVIREAYKEVRAT
ncbi:MAG: 2-oxoacid:acceptor oxidoreductase family protein [Candidatus Bathyarchaeota archaeon]|nr:MAG: 2-oxoacid:acceptor oxidoreductase family protein [Candidatus Bathyarchaeota archaeon]